MLELVYKSPIRDMCDLNEHCLCWERTFIMDIFPLRHFPDTRMRWHDKKCKCCVAIGKQIAPTFLVRESVNLLLPLLTTLVNTSLMQGRLPASQKHAIVTPRLNTDRIPLTSPTFGKKYTSQLFRTLCTKSYSNRSILDCVTQEKIGCRFFERRYIDRCVYGDVARWRVCSVCPLYRRVSVCDCVHVSLRLPAAETT